MFEYPSNVPLQKHGPRGYKDYSSYKPWLRDEFTFRCVYCLERETWYPDRSDSFAVEHISARSIDPHNETNYLNLVYACGRCNSFKGKDTLLNPRAVGLAHHLRVHDDGHIEGLSDDGWILIEQLHLNEWPALENRRDILLFHTLWLDNRDDEKVQRLFSNKFGFPENLPNLTDQIPPLGNSIDGSENNSYHQMKISGNLPRIY